MVEVGTGLLGSRRWLAPLVIVIVVIVRASHKAIHSQQ